MDPLKNPFSPGAGAPPPFFTGRVKILERTRIALARLKAGRPEKSFLLVGLRGVGKTVLLNEIQKLAEENDYYSIFVEAHEDKSLEALLLPHLRQLLFALDRKAEITQSVKRGLRVFKSFLNSIKIKFHDIEMTLDVDPETGTADSGDLESDLPILLESIAKAVQDTGNAVAIIIDELQYLSERELSALIMSVHKLVQKQLPLMIVGAGLPFLVGLAGRSKSYAERLFDFPSLGALSQIDAYEAMQNPLLNEGMQFSDCALVEILNQTKGYPYFLQEWGYHAWNLAHEKIIDKKVIDKATIEAIKRLDESFFRVRFDRMTPAEKRYLYALAQLGSGPQRSGNIADILGVKPQSVAPIRSKLFKKGMIYSPNYGDTEFTVPLFDDFMKRMMTVDFCQLKK